MNKEKDLLKLQLFASILFLITLLISIYTTNYILNHGTENQDKINTLSYKARIVATIAIILFSYVAFENYKISKEENRDDLYLQKNEVIISILTIIASAIALYNASQRASTDIVSTENPEI